MTEYQRYQGYEPLTVEGAALGRQQQFDAERAAQFQQEMARKAQEQQGAHVGVPTVTHADRIAELEAQVKALSASLDTARNQIDRLAGQVGVKVGPG